ncbi:predicted protein, partial [Micromonas commoda]
LGRVLEAAETGDENVLAVALPALSVSVDTTGPDGDTALHLASLYGHARCVEMILAAGASVTVRDADGGTPLHDASAGGFEPITPLHMAARGGYPNVVRALLSAGARPDVKSDAGLYPWNYADEGSELEAML